MREGEASKVLLSVSNHSFAYTYMAGGVSFIPAQRDRQRVSSIFFQIVRQCNTFSDVGCFRAVMSRRQGLVKECRQTHTCLQQLLVNYGVIRVVIRGLKNVTTVS